MWNKQTGECSVSVSIFTSQTLYRTFHCIQDNVPTIHSQQFINFKQYDVDLLSIFRNIEKWLKNLGKKGAGENFGGNFIGSTEPIVLIACCRSPNQPTNKHGGSTIWQNREVANKVEARIQLHLGQTKCWRGQLMYIYCIYKSYIPQHPLNLCTINNMQERSMTHVEVETGDPLRNTSVWLFNYKPLILHEKNPMLAECSQWQLIFKFNPPILPEKTPKCGTPCNLGNYFNVRGSHTDHQH